MLKEQSVGPVLPCEAEGKRSAAQGNKKTFRVCVGEERTEESGSTALKRDLGELRDSFKHRFLFQESWLTSAMCIHLPICVTWQYFESWTCVVGRVVKH